ncbi:acyltransferase family protein [Spirosoma litoris]
MLNREITNENNRIIILDSLRGFCAMIVLFHHFFEINNFYFFYHFNKLAYRLLEQISHLNQEAVTFFFVLSGFSIGLSLKDKQLTQKLVINEYFYRRFKRILPIYWLSLLIAFLIGSLMGVVNGKEFSLFNLIGNLLFLQTAPSIPESWFVPFGFNGCLWSLAYEFFFYLLFPFVFFVNSKVSNFSIVFKFFILFLVTLLSIFLNKLFFMPYILFFGGFMVWLLGYINSLFFLKAKNLKLLFLVVLVIGLAGSLITRTYIHSASVMVLSRGLLMNAFFYFVLFLSRSKLYPKLLFNKIQDFLNIAFYEIGLGSYAIYAIHYPVLLFLKYYDFNLFIQLPIIVVLILVCIFLEKRVSLLKLDIFKINYFKVFQNRSFVKYES